MLNSLNICIKGEQKKLLRTVDINNLYDTAQLGVGDKVYNNLVYRLYKRRRGRS